jgi:hypothetical protein
MVESTDMKLMNTKADKLVALINNIVGKEKE